jgi:hypothetical protein
MFSTRISTYYDLKCSTYSKLNERQNVVTEESENMLTLSRRGVVPYFG